MPSSWGTLVLSGITSIALSQDDAPDRTRLDAVLAQLEQSEAPTLDVVVTAEKARSGCTISDLTYASGRGGRVPAFLVAPSGQGPFAGAVFQHAGQHDRSQFVEEAVQLAQRGVVSLSIDAPWLRPGFQREAEDDLARRTLLDLRRALDLLVARDDVDPARLGFVGHSDGATWGSVFAAIEPRLSACVLMAGSVRPSRLPEPAPSPRWDGAQFLPHAETSLLLQFAQRDQHVTVAQAEEFIAVSPDPSTVVWYDCDHDFHQAARLDRARWLAAQLDLPADPGPAIAPLWPNSLPGPVGKSAPRLHVWRPAVDSDVGTAIVVCPGGGYGHLAMGHEGRDVATWLTSIGVTAFVLEYRHRGTGAGHPAPLLDVQRAIRTARAQLASWDRPDRVGVLGFSAGGHLAATATTLFDRGPVPDRGGGLDRIDEQSARPDFSVLVYPVVTFTEKFMHRGSRRNLLGEDPDPALLALLSPEQQVTDETPPTFLVHSGDDRGVPVENSLAFYRALRAHGVEAELHVYQQGGHGYGMRPNPIPAASWPDRCTEWMRSRGLLERR